MQKPWRRYGWHTYNWSNTCKRRVNLLPMIGGLWVPFRVISFNYALHLGAGKKPAPIGESIRQLALRLLRRVKKNQIMTSCDLIGVLYNYPDQQGGNTLTSGSYQELFPKIGML